MSHARRRDRSHPRHRDPRNADLDQFFDAGCPRRLEWADRPQAAALLAALSDPDREFDALVLGKYERAFRGDQLTRLAPTLELSAVDKGT